MKITRKETTPEPTFTEKDLDDQYAECLAFRGINEYRKLLPQYDANKLYVFYYRVMKKDGKETCIKSESFTTNKDAIAYYQKELATMYTDCYYIKILCVRKDITSLIKGPSSFVSVVIESEAIER